MCPHREFFHHGPLLFSCSTVFKYENLKNDSHENNHLHYDTISRPQSPYGLVETLGQSLIERVFANNRAEGIKNADTFPKPIKINNGLEIRIRFFIYLFFISNYRRVLGKQTGLLAPNDKIVAKYTTGIG